MEMILKQASELEDCEEGKKVILNFTNGEDYTGIYKGFDGDETIMLGAIESKGMIGLPFNMLDNYFQEA